MFGCGLRKLPLLLRQIRRERVFRLRVVSQDQTGQRHQFLDAFLVALVVKLHQIIGQVGLGHLSIRFWHLQEGVLERVLRPLLLLLIRAQRGIGVDFLLIHTQALLFQAELLLLFEQISQRVGARRVGLELLS